MDRKISELVELVLGEVSGDDFLAIVDVTANSTKKIKISSLAPAVASGLELSDLADVSGGPTLLNILLGDGTDWVSTSYLNLFPDLTGNAGKVLAVNISEDGFEWITGSGGGGGVELSDVNVWTAGNSGAKVAVTYASTITLDFNDGNFFSTTLTGNVTLANPNNIPNGGKSGSIWIRQDGSGSKTWSLGSYWKTKGSTPSLSTAANAIDRLDYVVESSTRIEYVLTKGITS